MSITHNFPLQTMPFIGRYDEIVAITQRLTDPACGVLTLVGPGGIGKTRLATEVAQNIAQTQAPLDSLYFVDLQPVNSIEVLVTAIANSLGILFSGSEDPRVRLLRYLDERKILVLLDNFEQILDGATLVADMVKIAPGSKILVTSREALNIQEEWVWQVGGLQVPDQPCGVGIESFSAVQLFVERARRTRRDFTLAGQESHITRICQLAEGMPLALELAASWTKSLPCAEIADEIQRSIEFLTTTMRNVPERHRSMQAVFDQSWRLLTEAERQVFVRLSIFKGGFRREAAEQVAGASLSNLSGLVAKSFLYVSTDGRYEIQELIRQYGEEHLKAVAGAKEEAQQRHCVYYAGFLHQRQMALRGPQQAAALDEIENELDNVRASWLWAVEHGLRDEIHRAMHSLAVFCHIRAYTVDSEHLFALAVKRFEHEDSATLAYLLLALSWAAGMNGRVVGEKQYVRAIRLVYTFWTDDVIALPLWAYNDLRETLIATRQFDDQQQIQVCRDFLDLFRATNQSWGAAYMLDVLGCLCNYNDAFEEAEKYFRESEELFLRIGDRWGSCWASMGLANVFECLGQFEDAHREWQAHQDMCAEVGDRGAAVAVPGVRAQIACKQKDFYAARSYIAQGIKAHLELRSPLYSCEQVFRPMIDLFMGEGNYERAAELLSFLVQHADTEGAFEMAAVAQQSLELLSQMLTSDQYYRAVARGKTLHLRTILEQVLDELSAYSPRSPELPQLDALTEREVEVLRLTVAGNSNRQIARDLFLSLNTVKSHIHHIYGKLGVESRTEAISRARDLHLL